MFKKLLPGYLFLALMLTGVSLIISAQSTGTITGRITDQDSGNPIIGASVFVVGTTKGAITDLDGQYTIKNLQVGIYTLRISHMEYSSIEIVDQAVTTDSVTVLNLTMKKKVTELDEEIKVNSPTGDLDKFVVSGQTTTSKELFKKTPVTSVDDILTQIAGVVTNSKGDVIIRGGRAGEVSSHIIKFRPLGDPLGGINKLNFNYAEPGQYYPPAHGGNSIVNGEPYDAMFFKNYGVNPFVDPADDHLSTFAIDVDDASYIMARSYLERGALPPNEAIRTEEFVNHFSYNYPALTNDAFRVYFEGARSPFGQREKAYLLKIGIKGRKISDVNRRPANLVFVVDVSGSMGREDRLGLVRKALRLLVNELTPKDQVGIVVYGTTGQVVLEPTSIINRDKITAAIEKLYPSGATNAEQGIRLGYQMADRCFDPNKINRIILCSDGVANVGVTGPDALLKQIKKYADKGITLSSIGFGMGNYNDVLLEKLGNKGNGFYAYVDNLSEARRIFVDNLTGTLEVIARDVKIQVDFDPKTVRSYRLLGYENRDVADNKFRDDKEDGGEIGSGHEVTALYEIKLNDDVTFGNVGTIYVRYKNPDGTEVDEVNFKINTSLLINDDNSSAMSSELKLAATAAKFSELLRGSYWAKGSNFAAVLSLAKEVYDETGREDVLELMSLISKANQFDQLANK